MAVKFMGSVPQSPQQKRNNKAETKNEEENFNSQIEKKCETYILNKIILI